MRKIVLGILAAGTAVTALPATAAAQPGYYGGGYYSNPYDRNGDGYVSRREARQAERQQQRYDNRYYGNQYGNRYDNRYYGNQYSNYYDRSGYYNGPTWRGNDGRYYCRRSDGTTGTIIGGAAGALVGSQVAGRGDRTLGAILGGAIGAVIGNSVERSNNNNGYRCR